MYQQVNGKKAAGKTPEMSPLHEEIVRYVTDVWKNVSREYDKSRQDAREGNRVPSVVYFQEKNPSPCLIDFKPFDLEAWWGKRVVHSLTTASPQ